MWWSASNPTSLHRNKVEAKSDVVSLHTNSTLISVHGSRLHVVPLLVTWGNATVRTNAFLDSGSTHSFCSHSLLNKLKCDRKEITILNLTKKQTGFSTYVVRGMVANPVREDLLLDLPRRFTKVYFLMIQLRSNNAAMI